jgi:acetyltransferase-like isoleucine patch superfamily enzyme
MIWRGCEIHSNVIIGERCVIGAFCTIFGGAVIGDGCKIEGHTDIFNGVELGKEVFVGPSVVFTNDLTPRANSRKRGVVATKIGDGVSIGANSTIVCGITIGAYAAVAAGSVVIRDIKPYELFAGNPAKFIRHVCKCNAWGVLTFEDGWATCPSCRAKYELRDVVVPI